MHFKICPITDKMRREYSPTLEGNFFLTDRDGLEDVNDEAGAAPIVYATYETEEETRLVILSYLSLVHSFQCAWRHRLSLYNAFKAGIVGEYRHFGDRITDAEAAAERVCDGDMFHATRGFHNLCIVRGNKK
jgi:hypothetical protein